MASYKVCLAASGQVRSVEPVAGIPDADGSILATLRTWLYKARPTAVCFVQFFEFQVEGPRDGSTRAGSAGRFQKHAWRFVAPAQLDLLLPPGTNPEAFKEQMRAGLARAVQEMEREADRQKEPGWAREMEARYKRELASAQSKLGAENPALVDRISELARFYISQKRYVEAELLFLRAMAIAEKSTSPDLALNMSLLNEVASFYFSTERYTEAQKLFRKQLALLEQLHGPESVEVSHCLQTLKVIQIVQGEYEEAERSIKRVMAIREKNLGPDSLLIAHSLTDLATLFLLRGKHAEAEQLARRALGMLERRRGAEHTEIVPTLTILAALYRAMGQFARAEDYYKRALAIRERTLDPEDPEVANRLNGLGCLYLDQGKYALAEPLLRRALAIREKVRGPDHSDIANSLINLASIHEHSGQPARAEQLLRRAIAIQERTLGSEHPELAGSYVRLFLLAKAQAQQTEAEIALKRALAIQQKKLGSDHPDVAESLGHLARLETDRGNLSAAIPILQSALQLEESALRQAVSESRVVNLLDLHRAKDEWVYSLLLKPTHDPRLRPLAFTLSLLHKGRAAEAGAQANRAVFDSLASSEQRARFEEWQRLRAQREKLFFAGPANERVEEHQQRLAALKLRIEVLEQELADASPLLRSLQIPRWDEILSRVAGALPQGSALLEVVLTWAPPLQAPVAASRPGNARYLGMLLFPDQRIEVVDLGDAEAVDGAAAELLQHLRERSRDPLPAAQRLHRMIMQPLRASLANVSRLYLSPDGSLNLVPFAALHDGERYLLDRLQLHYLTSGRDLLRDVTHSSEQPPLVLADPDYGATQPASAVSGARLVDDVSKGLYPVLQGLQRLPGTRKEATALARLVPGSVILLDQTATEQALRQANAPRIIHIATHGLFLEGAPQATPDKSTPEQGGSMRALVPLQLSPSGASADLRQLRVLTNPLSRSVLVLAGAAQAEHSGDTKRDGLLTAEEVRSLNLWGTELVVLSACDTGLGAVRAGEGVYGLRRAFLIAGAQTLVTSLWQVADAETGELMKLYYEKLVKQKKSRVEAMQEGMQEMRKRKPHPYYWAPFIVVGSDGPLRSILP